MLQVICFNSILYFVMDSLEVKKRILEQWHITRSFTAFRRSFRKLPGYYSKNLPPLTIIWNVKKAFETTGSVAVVRKGKTATLDPGGVQRVRRAYQNRQRLSLIQTAKRLA